MNRFFPFQSCKRPALRIGLDFFDSADAVQFVLVITFDARFADVGRATVVPFIDPVQVVNIQPADISQYMGEQLTIGIVPRQVRNDLDTVEPVAIDGKTRDLFLSQVELQRNTVEFTIPLSALLKIFERIISQFNYAAKRCDGLLNIPHFFRDQFQAVRRPVFGNRPAPPVVDQSPVRRDRNQPHLIIDRTGGKFLVADELQVNKAETEQDDGK